MSRFIKKHAKSWSFSSYYQWQTCSAQYYYGRLLKLPTPPVPAMTRGTEIHLKGEMFLKGRIRGTPPEFKNFATELRALKRHKARAEEDWCVTRQWGKCGPTDWDVVWGRCKTDAHVKPDKNGQLTVVDFKTGRIYSSNRLQAEVDAAIAPAYHEFDSVLVEFWYLDQNEMVPFEYTRKQVTQLQKKFERKLKPYFEDRSFEATPGHHCTRCPFRSSKKLADGTQGPCDAWKRA